MCFQVYFKPSHRYIERELESSAKTKASTPQLILRRRSAHLSIFWGKFKAKGLHLWYNLHSFIYDQRGRKFFEGLISHSKYPFLAIHAKGGESMSPKQKDRTTTLIFKMIFQIGKFQIGISLCSKGGESSTFKIDILKPS
jgi:hypothetical protein